MEDVKRITVLVNPAAGNGSGFLKWAQVKPHFEALFATYDKQVVLTNSREHAIELGRTLETDLLVSFSGDGAFHDIAQGVLARPRDERPLFTVVPIGSGNDCAKALGIPSGARQALEALATGRSISVDVGRCNESFFVNTLSFGIDAAIAAKTHELRKATGSSGFLLYLHAAILVILHDLKPHHLCATMDGAVVEQDVLICAVQNGPTYGGGFTIAPRACIHDGLFDICTVQKASTPKALYYMTRIARGTHERLPIVSTYRAHTITLDFDAEMTAQLDGEPARGAHFEVELLSEALDVLVPQSSGL